MNAASIFLKLAAFMYVFGDSANSWKYA